nr:hypothetical protein [Microvirga arvi]
MTVTRLLELAAPEPFGQHGALILGNGSLNLQQKLIIRIIGDGMVQEHHLASDAPELLQQQDLIGVFASQTVWTEHRHHIDGGVAHRIAQSIQARPVQAGSTVPLVTKDMGVSQDMAVCAGPVP